MKKVKLQMTHDDGKTWSQPMAHADAPSAMLHTPTPWESEVHYIFSADNNRWKIAETNKNQPNHLADAAFIVRACNNFENLLNAAKACEDELSQIQFSVPDALTKKITILRKAIHEAEK